MKYKELLLTDNLVQINFVLKLLVDYLHCIVCLSLIIHKKSYSKKFLKEGKYL